MPELTVDGKSGDVPEGRRLVLAIESLGVNIGHRCGGNARCTTCRVEFVEGEPDTMTEAEYIRLKARDLYGQYRLSCQIICDHPMSVRPQMTLENQESWTDTGPPPDPTVQPTAEWFPRQQLEQRNPTEAG
jgi:ferredoxin